MKTLPLYLVSLLCLLATSCATIVRGTDQTISIDSTPNGAEVTIDGALKGETPLVIKLGKQKELAVTVTKDGYQDRTFMLSGESSWGWTLFGNCLCGGTTGTTTDLMTGAHLEYTPSSYHIQLSPKSAMKRDEQRPQMEIVHYILANYIDLKAELAKRDGSYLRGLLGLFNQHFSHMSMDTLVAHMQKLQERYDEPTRFAEQVSHIGL